MSGKLKWVIGIVVLIAIVVFLKSGGDDPKDVATSPATKSAPAKSPAAKSSSIKSVKFEKGKNKSITSAKFEISFHKYEVGRKFTDSAG
jgi:hypothetical protein